MLCYSMCRMRNTGGIKIDNLYGKSPKWTFTVRLASWNERVKAAPEQ
jgi:hypothetical protein